MKPTKDNFSTQASIYQKYRPDYPDTLYHHIFRHCVGFEQAWDCATGNGQVAVKLAEHFERVRATDISEAQLANAPEKDNIKYELGRAEQSNLTDQSVDLVTIGQAIHWFDFDQFYGEVNRVLKKDGLIAAWTYGLFRTRPEIDRLIDEFYADLVGDYWDEERKLVDALYETIPFPFDEIKSAESFETERFWTIGDVEGYLNTWSSVAHYKREHQVNPVDDFIPKIRASWQGKERVVFTNYLKLGRKHS